MFHKKIDTTLDDRTNTRLIQPQSQWNRNHRHPPLIAAMLSRAGWLYLFKPPAAVTPIEGNMTLTVVDLRWVERIRLVTNVRATYPGSGGTENYEGPSGSEVRVQYSTNGTIWDYPAADMNPRVSFSTGGLKDSGWKELVTGAKTEPCWLRLVTVGGNGVKNWGIGSTFVYVR